MQPLLRFSQRVDSLNNHVGRAASWLTLAAVLVSSGNASYRYIFNNSSNAWLELQWYLFSAVFLLCGAYALQHNQHVRIDVVYQRWSRRTQLWIDIFGTVFFLMPMALLILYLGWELFVHAWVSKEVSSNAGGLIVWPARLLLPVGFFLLVLQGFSELIKRIAVLQGFIPDPATSEHGPSAEEELAMAIQAAREAEAAKAKS